MREPRDRLAERHHLPGFRQRRGDHAVGVRLEVRISELVVGKFERAPRPLYSPLSLILGSLLALIVRNCRVAAGAKALVAQFVSGGLGETRRGGRKFGVSAFDLELVIRRIEPRYRIAGPDPIVGIDETSDHPAGYLESKICI